MTTLTTIEKAAKLMGYAVAERKPNFNYYHLDADTVGTFDPYTSKSNLSDVIDELGIDVIWFADEKVRAYWRDYTNHKHFKCYGMFSSDHPNKFTARAHAVMAVVEQIYDAKFGKDRE